MSSWNRAPTDDQVVAAAAALSAGRPAQQGNGTIQLPGGCTTDIQRHLGLTHSSFLKPVLGRLVKQGRLDLRRIGAFRCYVPAQPKQEAS